VSHATHMHESCHTYKRVMPHTWIRFQVAVCVMEKIKGLYAKKEACHTYEWDMSHICHTHKDTQSTVPYTCHTHETWGTHTWHICYTDAVWHTWDICHTHIAHVPHAPGTVPHTCRGTHIRLEPYTCRTDATHVQCHTHERQMPHTCRMCTTPRDLCDTHTETHTQDLSHTHVAHMPRRCIVTHMRIMPHSCRPTRKRRVPRTYRAWHICYLCVWHVWIEHTHGICAHMTHTWGMSHVTHTRAPHA